MQAEKQQLPWRINIYARSKNFNFRFKATRSLPFPSWNFHRLSILFRIRRYFILRVKSESPDQQRPALKSRLLRGFERFRARRAKKRSVAAKQTLNLQPPETKSSINHLRRLAHEEPVYIGSLVVGILAFLFRSTSVKVISFVILLNLTMLLKKHVCGRRSMAALAFPVLSTLVFSSGVSSH
ncbi:hypothetical protein Pint_35057 [Pistacia integerrima]|uniref:Uncharacterized protein n=1 Tax=Pistacia integerrima TaxID=434235 RepID=A0ACC0Y0W1_9ROSI|nr:hypothetical protein Pint_35057 [Pistacia integerrima]